MIKTYKTIILPVVLYGCETWSLTLKEEYKLKTFENRMLRRIFRPKRDEIIGGWRKMNNEQLHKLYSSPDIRMKSKNMRWAWHVACTSRGENIRAYNVFLGNVEGKRSLGRLRHRWENTIKMDSL
jgi:hypothetical protein